MITIKSKREIAKIKESCHIVYLALEAVKKAIRVGITTKELDQIAEKVIIENGAKPSCKGYPEGSNNPFPATCCISVNDEIIHGIPSSRKLKEGDIVSVDIVADKDGYYGDAARTYPVGQISKEAQALITATEESFWEGIKEARPGNRVSDISYAIEQRVKKDGYTVIREFQGHGVGSQMHEEPGIPNFGKPGKGIRLEEGMTLAIEPMVNMGAREIEEMEDGWTIVTKDGKISAHYENTIVITQTGCEVLTNN